MLIESICVSQSGCIEILAKRSNIICVMGLKKNNAENNIHMFEKRDFLSRNELSFGKVFL